MSLMVLDAKLSLNSSEFNEKLKEAGGNFTKGLKNAATLGAKAIGVATAAAGAFGLSALKVGGEFDSSMSQIAATLGYTTEDIKNNVDGAGDAFEALREKAKEMGATTNFSASQAADGLNILAMSGYDANQSMEMIEDVLHLAAAGAMDMGQAAAYVSGTMKGFNDDTKDAGYYADLMAKGATLANTNVSQLGEAMTAGAAGASAYKQSADSMTLALLRLAEQGETGSAAGTALAAAMKNLYTPTASATKALEELGVSAYDSEGKTRDFNDVVNDLDSALNAVGENGLPKYTEAQKNALKQSIFGIQGLDAYNKMIVTGAEKQAEWADALASASEGAGEVAKQYNTMTDNLQGDIDIWKSALDGFKIAVSDKFMPAARNIVQFGSSALSELTKAFEEGGIEAAVGKLGDIFSDGLGMIIKALPQAISIGTDLVVNIVNGLIKAVPTLLEAVPEIVTSLYDGLKNAVPKLKEAGSDLFNTLLTGIKEEFPQMIPIAMNAIMEFSGSLRETASTLIDSGLELIMALADGIIQNLPVLIETIPTIIINIAGIINDNAPTILAAGITLIGNLVSGIIQAVPTIIAEFPKIIQAIFAVMTAVNWAALGANIVTFIGNGVKSLATNLPNILKNIGENAWNALKGVNWASLGSTIINFIKNGISGLASSIPTALRSIGTTAWNAFKSINWINLGANIISGIASGITNGVGKIADAAKNAAKKAFDAAKNFLKIGSPSKLFRDEIGKRMAEGMAIGFEDNIPDLDMQAALSKSVDSLSVESPEIKAGENNRPLMIEIPLLLNDSGLKEIARSSVVFTAEELERLSRSKNRVAGVASL